MPVPESNFILKGNAPAQSVKIKLIRAVILSMTAAFFISYFFIKIIAGIIPVEGYLFPIVLTSVINLVIVGSFMTFMINRDIIDPVNRLSNLVRKISAGDLSVAMHYRGGAEIAALYAEINSMAGGLRHLVGQVQNYTQKLTCTVEDFNSNTHRDSHTRDDLHKITDRAERVNNKAWDADGVAQEAAVHTHKGNSNVQKVVSQMEAINHTFNNTVAIISEVSEKSNEISKITELIASIAESTNLLALNAAIEAARAGEHGRGFSVVAEEVQALADQSARAAGEIENLINGMQEQAQKTVATINAGSAEVKTGTAVAKEAGLFFNQIDQSMQTLTAEIQEIALSAEQVAEGIENLAGTREYEAASTETMNTNREQLTALSARLQEITGALKA